MGQIIVNIENPAADHQPALDAASALCESGDTLCLFHNLYHPRFAEEQSLSDEDGVLAEARELLQQKREAQLQSLAEKIAQSCDYQTVWSREGWQQLVRLARQRDARLVVGQTRPQSRWKRLRLGNEDWELIRHCPAPLLLVRDREFTGYHKILAAVDPLHSDDKPSDLDRRILTTAAKISAHFNGQVDVLNLVPPGLAVASSLSDPVSVATSELEQVELAQHRQKVTELVTECDAGPDFHECVELGEPTHKIVTHAEEMGAELLVMGAVARSALRRMLVGSTAERVLDQVPCDVLIVKPANFDPRLPPLASLAPIDF